MKKIIACIDNSQYADSVCQLSTWVAKHTKQGVILLHVAAPHTEMKAKTDLSGYIGLGAKSSLLKNLTQIDEAHGKEEQQKGHKALTRATKLLAENGIVETESAHRRGDLIETVLEMEAKAELIVIGKGGEHDNDKDSYIGNHLGRLAHAIHRPLLIATKEKKPINRLLIAYDGSQSSNQAVDYIVGSPLFKDIECHLLMVGEATIGANKSLSKAESKLKNAGLTVSALLREGKSVAMEVTDYIKRHDIGLLAIGAYGHSKIRNMMFGSTTTELIRKTGVPILLFRR